MNWGITLVKGLKFAGIAILATLLASLTPEALSAALAQLPLGIGHILAPVLAGLIASALNAVKHWSDPKP